jgi:hypothetical protein
MLREKPEFHAVTRTTQVSTDPSPGPRFEYDFQHSLPLAGRVGEGVPPALALSNVNRDAAVAGSFSKSRIRLTGTAVLGH